MRKFNVGDRLKRKFADFQEVEVVGHLNDHLIIKDASGRHFVKLDKVDEFFISLSEAEEVELQTNYIQPKD